MDAKVTWKGGLSFDGTADSGFSIALGARKEAGGADDGFRPLELLLVGLAGCTAMDVISMLQKSRQEITGFEVNVRSARAEDHPKVFTDIVIEYELSGRGLDREAIERAVSLSENKYCSAQAMLGKTAKIDHVITVKEVEA